MADALTTLSDTIGVFVESGVTREDAEQLVALQRQALERFQSHTALDTLDAADAEEAVLAALEDLGVEEAWRHAEPLAVAGVTREWLDAIQAHAGPATNAAIAWVSASLTARSLSQQLCSSTQQMSRLVGAVKKYAYMDRGELVEVDIHEGLETTLIVLGHKLKHTDIEIVRAYDRSIPKVTVWGSELNQVWTNLLDNAIDALGQSGTITLTTKRDDDCVQVEITDDGPGIPPGEVGRVFDPFFTTKAVGQGTGLGLDTSRRIVVDRHGGSLSVKSQPGATTFSVRLPIVARGMPASTAGPIPAGDS
jgi:signal transduction histidine kinase